MNFGMGFLRPVPLVDFLSDNRDAFTATGLYLASIEPDELSPLRVFSCVSDIEVCCDVQQCAAHLFSCGHCLAFAL